VNGGINHSSQQFGPVGRWWDDKSVIKTLGLSKDQQKKMDVIFEQNKPAILQSYKAFLSEQAKLDKLNKDSKSDQASVFAEIDSVSKARATLQKATAQMLIEVRQQMDEGQISKLEKLQ
jgi:Spy/CpxP family protein refolding chaperone